MCKFNVTEQWLQEEIKKAEEMRSNALANANACAGASQAYQRQLELLRSGKDPFQPVQQEPVCELADDTSKVVPVERPPLETNVAAGDVE